MLLISGIYIVPYLDVPAVPYLGGVAGLAFGKQILFVCLIVMMGSTLSWREAIGSMFTLLCCIWVLIHMSHWLLRQEYSNIYFQRMVQIAFIWVFVNYILQQREDDRKQFLSLQVLYYPPLFGTICILLVMFSFNPEIARLIDGGFGGNRFGFSIWLSQFIFLTFFVYLNLNSKSISIRKAIVWATPILILQVFSGGRTGLLASFAIFLYFAYQQGGFRVILLCVLYLTAVCIFSSILSNWIGTYSSVGVGSNGGISLHILRIAESIPSEHFPAAISSEHNLINWNQLLQLLDRISSYRLSIMTDAFSRTDIWSLIFGTGVGNFQGSLPTGTMNHVHNIYVRALGELGVIGFATLIAMVALPFRKKFVNLVKFKSVSQNKNNSMLVYCGIVILVGMLHSEYLTTALSTCMLFWLCYAEIIRVQT
jgi:hypothetical protein